MLFLQDNYSLYFYHVIYIIIYKQLALRYGDTVTVYPHHLDQYFWRCN